MSWKRSRGSDSGEVGSGDIAVGQYTIYYMNCSNALLPMCLGPCDQSVCRLKEKEKKGLEGRERFQDLQQSQCQITMYPRL